MATGFDSLGRKKRQSGRFRHRQRYWCGSLQYCLHEERGRRAILSTRGERKESVLNKTKDGSREKGGNRVQRKEGKIDGTEEEK